MSRSLEFNPESACDFTGGPVSQILIRMETALNTRELYYMLGQMARDRTKSPTQQQFYDVLAGKAKQRIVEAVNDILAIFDGAVDIGETSLEYRSKHLRPYVPEVHSTPPGGLQSGVGPSGEANSQQVS